MITGTREPGRRPDLGHWLARFVAKFGAVELWVVGDATGVDDEARRILIGRDQAVEVVRVRPGLPSPWRYYERNGRMVRLGAAGGPGSWCLGFAIPGSRGTHDTLDRARAVGLRSIALPLLRGVA